MCIADLRYAVLWRDGTIEEVESSPIAGHRARTVDGAALYRSGPGEEWHTIDERLTPADMLARWAHLTAAGE